LFKELLDKIACGRDLFKCHFEESGCMCHDFVNEGLGHSSYVIDLVTGR
jgi:hypothetical protein